MRKTVPVLLLTSMFALASGSAFALGDRNKEKKASGTTASTQSATTSSSRCDASKYASRADMPKDCPDTTGTQADKAGSTTGKTGGESGATGSTSSSTGASGSSSSGSSPSK